jgi:hypothetical protein
MCNKLCLVFVNRAVGLMLELEDPFAADNVFAFGAQDSFPGVHMFKCLNVVFHYLLPLGPIRVRSCLGDQLQIAICIMHCCSHCCVDLDVKSHFSMAWFLWCCGK